MNKSTPLSQLPSNLQNQNTFVNDQQKQMITNAQQAIQTVNLPQNTQVHQDMMNDDDATIQEVLNHINASQQPAQQPTQQHFNSPQMQMPQQMDIQQQLYQQPQQQMDQYIMQNMMNPNMMNMNTSSSHNTLLGHSSNIDMFFHIFADDIKVAILIVSLFVLVNFIPVGATLGRYIAVDKIPYHDVILKGVLCAILFLLTKKFVVK